MRAHRHAAGGARRAGAGALARGRGGEARAREAHQPRRPDFDREAYRAERARAHNRVERLIDRLRRFRRPATGYGKPAASHLAMLTIGMTRPWL